MRTFIFLAVLSALLAVAATAQAREQYARQTGKPCSFCHQDLAGGPINDTGFAYARNGLRYPIPERVIAKAQALRSPLHRNLRLIFGALHLIAAAVFAGTIFYIHIFIRPGKLTSGIPIQERKLGVSSMVILVLTGLYLSWTRIDNLHQLVNTSFGLVLHLKLILFILMAAIAVTAITVVNRRMRAAAAAKPVRADDKVPAFVLTSHNGAEGRPAFIAAQGKVYNVTGNAKWKDGRHFGKHQAGADLTEALAKAPHGEEVLQRVRLVGELAPAKGPPPKNPAAKVFVVMAYANLILVVLILGCVAFWHFGPAVGPSAAATTQAAADSCVDCHLKTSPGIVDDYRAGVHAQLGVSCLDCHLAAPGDPMAVKAHLEENPSPVAALVTPKKCAGCHPQQVKEFGQSKHAHTLEIINRIDLWLGQKLLDPVETVTGCFHCHGSVVELEDGKPRAGTWPNVGIGRVNPDGSLGSCSSCHTRHRFSAAEARKPEACGQCHLGPDHPQIEIYAESKHGAIYATEGDSWNWAPDDGKWTAGRDYRAPTCASCHMSAAAEQPSSHDVTRRLAWELQAPLTIRPADFKPFPAAGHWQDKRQAMSVVCLQCHSAGWTQAHFDNFDAAVNKYNRDYYAPAKAAMDDLYGRGLLSTPDFFDDDLEWDFYELWHHEGRRARMGAAMMAPDYAWWHGFYELKHRYRSIMEQYNDLVGPEKKTFR